MPSPLLNDVLNAYSPPAGSTSPTAVFIEDFHVPKTPDNDIYERGALPSNISQSSFSSNLRSVSDPTPHSRPKSLSTSEPERQITRSFGGKMSNKGAHVNAVKNASRPEIHRPFIEADIKSRLDSKYFYRSQTRRNSQMVRPQWFGDSGSDPEWEAEASIWEVDTLKAQYAACSKSNARGEPSISSWCITPEAAQLHIAKEMDKFERVLASCHYTGLYSFHAGFNKETIHLQDPEQEIYVILEPDNISSFDCAELEHYLDILSSPFAAVMMVVEDTMDNATVPEKESYAAASDTGHLDPSDNDAYGSSKDTNTGSSGSASDSGGSEDSGNSQNLGKAKDEGTGHDDDAGNNDDDESGGDEPHDNNSETTKRISDATRGPLHIPFSASLIHKVGDRREKFEINSYIKVAVNEKADVELWPGPSLTVDVRRLHASHQSHTNLYTLGFCQSQVSASSCQTTVLEWSPTVVHAEDSSMIRDQHSLTGSASLALAMNPSFRLDGKINSSNSIEREQQPWIISSYRSESGHENSQGILWNYWRNLKGGYSPISMEDFQRKPRLVFGLDNVSPVALPKLKVYITILWSFDRQLFGKTNLLRRPRGDPQGLPTYLDIMHHVLMEVDLQKFAGNAVAVLERPVEDEISPISIRGAEEYEYQEFDGHHLALINSPLPSELEVEIVQAVKGCVRGLTMRGVSTSAPRENGASPPVASANEPSPSADHGHSVLEQKATKRSAADFFERLNSQLNLKTKRSALLP
ncbi:hypothetical protein H0H93_013554 [Arthromyces matolae]|nr:hypothetical protein H0H93_013554 [Arthromyces matolae]